MTPDELRARCAAWIGKNDLSSGDDIDIDLLTALESLCREMMGKAFVRSMSIIEVCIWEYAPGSPEIHALRVAVDRMKTEAQRVKEGGQ